MARNPKYDVLFEPIELGPKTLPNRFWQVPHCNGAGSDRPGMQAEFRAVKAEGGWGAVFTEVCVMSPDGDVMPWVGAKLWDEGDVRNLSLMCERIHDHDALAGVEMAFPGGLAANAETRAPGRVVSQIPSDVNPMANGRELSKDEIRRLRREHVEGAKRARSAGFDLLTLYCSLGTFPMYFLYPFYNKRTDEYGGSFENRIRFTREVLEDMREEIDDCAIGCRFAIDTLEEPYGHGDLGIRHDGEGAGFIEALDDLVDYWDLNIGTLNWGEDAGSSRFFDMNHQAAYTRIAKTVSKKPCVNVGRFTDPDVMVDAINSGQCDIIGAARPSIADPFLPRKIEEGRPEDIRECIACNVCVSRWEMGGPPIWCTQNATSGEEYRRGWHPERFSEAANADNDVLIVGAGPAGMECATVLGKRGMRRVHILDRDEAMGGHLRWLTRLPGLGTWSRVTQYREGQIAKLSNVQFVPKTELAVDGVLEYGAEIVIIATGSRWDATGMSGPTHMPVAGASAEAPFVLTPEQLAIEGKEAGGALSSTTPTATSWARPWPRPSPRRATRSLTSRTSTASGPTCGSRWRSSGSISDWSSTTSKSSRSPSSSRPRPVASASCRSGRGQRASSRPTASCWSPVASPRARSTTSSSPGRTSRKRASRPSTQSATPGPLA